MGTKIALVKNTFWLGMVEVASKIIMFGVTISIVRYLGPSNFGSYNLAFAYVSIYTILSDLGLNTIATRDVAKNRHESQKYLENILGIRLGLSIVIMIAILISLIFLKNPAIYPLIIMAAIYSLLQNGFTTFNAIFAAWERMELLFLTRLVYYLGVFGGAMLVIRLGGNVFNLVQAYTITTLMATAVGMILMRHFKLKVRFGFNKTFWKMVLKESLPMLGLSIVGTLYANTDTLLIGKFLGDEKVGFYQAAYKILFAFQSINVINNAIFPRINVLLREKNYLTLHKLIRLVIIVSAIGLIPLAVGITIFRETIVKLIYGERYLVASGTLAMLIWAGVINYFRIFTSNLLFARNKQSLVFWGVSAGLIVNVTINFFLMPTMGFEYSAVAMVASEVVVLAVTSVFAVRQSNR